MRAYRCYLLNKAGTIAGVEIIDCDGDGDAQQAALKILRERSPHAVEVWDEARQVFSKAGEDAATERARDRGGEH